MIHETYDERLAKLIRSVHNACCDGPLEHDLARRMLKALLDLRFRYGRLAKTARGRRRDIKNKAAYIRHQDNWMRSLHGWNSHLVDIMKADVRRMSALEAACTQNYGALVEAGALLFGDRSSALSEDEAHACIRDAIEASNSGADILERLSSAKRRLTALEAVAKAAEDVEPMEVCGPIDGMLSIDVLAYRRLRKALDKLTALDAAKETT